MPRFRSPHTRIRQPLTPLQWFIRISLGLIGFFIVYKVSYAFSGNDRSSSSPLPAVNSGSINSAKMDGRAPPTQIIQKIGSADFSKCSAEQAHTQGETFAAAKVRGCPPADDIWLRLVHMIIPQAKVFVDIGSNKGYSAARFYSLWNPELGLDAPTLYKHIKKTTKEKEVLECGACGDCHEEGGPLFDLHARLCSDDAMYTSDGNRAHKLRKAGSTICGLKKNRFTPIRVYSFDGNDVLVNGVQGAINDMKDNLRPVSSKKYSSEFLPEFSGEKIASSWTVELRAFTEACSPGQTLTFIQNGELGHISDDSTGEGEAASVRGTKIDKIRSKGREVKVPCITVDQFLDKEKLQHVDFLKIDTEGHDLSVLDGATVTLRDSKVTVVVFEYNVFWPETRNGIPALKSISEELANNNYVCYLEGKNVLVRITACWDEALGEKQWSNIWCFSSSHPKGAALIAIFDSYSLAFSTV